MGRARGFAHAHAFLEGEDVLGSTCNVLVLDLLGPSLDDLYWAYREVSAAQGFSAPTVLALLYDTLSRIQHVGARGFSHADVKPENLLLGRRGQRRGVVHLVDFGASESLAEPERQAEGELVGTPRYAPLRAHVAAAGSSQTRCDAHGGCRLAADIESLLYSMAAVSTGALPWDRCLDTDGRIRVGCEEELLRDKAAAVSGEAPDWAGAEGAPIRPVLLELMRRLHAAREGMPAQPAFDFPQARALVRRAYGQLTGRAQISRANFDWDSVGVSWPEHDDQVAEAVTVSSTASGSVPSAAVVIVGGTALLSHGQRREQPCD